jgi:hypothetical protein
LPADFEVFGQAVATSMADLLGGTTGQVLAKASNADMDFVWSADAAGMTNPMTTTGDTIYSSSGSTPARLGIGSTGQVLTVAGGVPSWAAASSGGYTLLSTTNLSGSTTSITGISNAYRDLVIVMNNVGLQTTAGRITFQFWDSGPTQLTGYTIIDGIISTGGASQAVNSFAYFASLQTSTTLKTATTDNAFMIDLKDYTSSVKGMQIVYNGRYTSGATTNRNEMAVGSVGAGVVAQFDVVTSAGTFNSGTVKIYGVK